MVNARRSTFCSVLIRLSVSSIAAAICGCTLFSHTNSELPKEPGPEEQTSFYAKSRATLLVDGQRGNPDVLFFLALSGGGSRAAYLSAKTMLELQRVYRDDVDLLNEVDVISSVSGGSLPAAYYVLSRDEHLHLAGGLKPLRSRSAAARISPKLKIEKRRVRCDERLTSEEESRLRRLLGSWSDRVVDLCAQPRQGVRYWRDAEVLERMKRNYIRRWMFSWLLPENFVKYWLTAWDRADIMAQTFQDNLYDSPVLGLQYEFKDLNPKRPYLIINATNATEQDTHSLVRDPYSFGSVFTFTQDDFYERLNSDISTYSVARAVMASSAFPLVFANMTLRDYRAEGLALCHDPLQWKAEHCGPHYVHVFDGGNSDNLGLKSVKRALFELAMGGALERYDKIVVFQIDAFTRPQGTKRLAADPRSLLSFVLDTNVVDAVDSLLQANRVKLVGEMQSGVLRWREGDCEPETRNLPPRLCTELNDYAAKTGKPYLDISDRVVFYHFGFDDVPPEQKVMLDTIPTSFSISKEHVKLLDAAVKAVIKPGNLCLQQIRDISIGHEVDIACARRVCEGYDELPRIDNRTTDKAAARLVQGSALGSCRVQERRSGSLGELALP
jgi:predicted acylesterase/phospholipase RssA